MSNKKSLADLGEFRVLNEIVFPALSSSGLSAPLGDDCAYIDLPHNPDDLLVITTDSTPKPLAWQLGHYCYETWGWYSVLINVSDLAAAGASPLAFTSSIEAPPDMPIDDFQDFFSGLGSACHRMEINNAGGNIRAAPRFESHGTAIGIVPRRQQISRAGCRPGDFVYIIGVSGLFISAYLRAARDGIDSLSHRQRTSLIRPEPQIRSMNILRNAGVVSAASDNSDGLLGALWNIAERSNCAIEINLREELISEEIRETAAYENINPWNMFFFWGDWQVVVSVAEHALDRFEDVVKQNQILYSELGRAREGPPSIYGLKNGYRRRLNLIRQENFKHTSYNIDVDEQLRFMLHSDLFVS